MMPLIAPPPPPGFIRLRFTGGANELSRLIKAGTHSPNISHAESVLPDGRIAAALVNCLFGLYPAHYGDDLLTQILVDIRVTPAQHRRWLDSILSMVGAPFDVTALAGQVIGITSLHQAGAYFCSSAQMRALTDAGLYRSTPGDIVRMIPIELYRLVFRDPRAHVHPLEHS